MRVKVKKSIFIGATAKAGEILEISEDDFNAIGEDYLEKIEVDSEEGNDSDGNTDGTEKLPSNTRRSARSKTK